MIDEALYQQATDELNSDRRRPHLWARACALSSDDHDEARYLYTNLRVEELIAEREAGGGSDAPAGTAAADAAASTGLALEPLDGDDPADPADAFAASLDDTEPHAPFDPAPAATRSRARPGAALEASSELDFDPIPATAPEAPVPSMPDRHAPGTGGGERGGPAPAAGDRPDGAGDGARPGSARDPMQLDLDTGEADLDAEEIVRADGLHADIEHRKAGVDDADPDGFDAFGSDAFGSDGGDRSDRAPSAGASAPADVPVLRTHVGGRPGAAPSWEDGGGGGIRLHDIDDQLDEVIDAGGGAGAAARRAFGDRVRNDYADPRDLDALLEDHRRPGGGPDAVELLDVIEDDGGTGRAWSVMEDDAGALRAIRRGVSWPALLATLPWLLAQGLLGTAIVYALLWVAALGGVAMTGVAWLDAGDAASDGTKFAFVGFAAIAFAGLVLAPFLRANRWCTRRLTRRGWELAGELRAGSAIEAVDRFRELDAGRH